MSYSRRVNRRLPCIVESLEKRSLLAASVTNIMPLGDSITSSFTGRASYRYWLWNSLANAGFSVNFVGTGAGVDDGDPLYPGFDPDHEGHTGFSASDIDSMLKSSDWANFAVQPKNKPDIVLLHIGSNDIEGGHDAAGTRDDIGNIIDDLRAVNPNVTVVLAQIIPEEDVSMAGLNRLLPGLASSKNTKRSHVILVNQAKGFDAGIDTFDGVHPDESGEKKMAAKWFAALKPLLPKPTPQAVGTYLDTTAVSLTHSDNAIGPVEYEESNGSDDQFDGNMLTIRGKSYMRGFGVHAPSELDFNLGSKAYSMFRASIGVDDEVDGAGSVVFRVYVNDEATPRYQSHKITSDNAAVPISVNIAGAHSLRLVVTDAGDNNESDHADWAQARVIRGVSALPAVRRVPAPPKSLVAAVGAHGINLSWKDSSTNELGFHVLRKTGAHGAWEQIAELGVNTRAFRDTEVSASTLYYYRVTAFNGDGSSRMSNLAAAITA